MSNTLVLNSSNKTALSNVFQYQFIQGSFHCKEGTDICVSNITIPYSFFNVSNFYNNQSFQFTWTVGTTTTTYTVTLPNGFYTVTEIDQYFQQYCILNGFYLINENQKNIFFVQMLYDVTYYSCQILTFPVEISLPSMWTEPSNFAGYPTSTVAPTVTIMSSNNFGTIIGFTAGTYGGGSTPMSYLSNITPVGSTVNSIIVRCNLVQNDVAFPTDILDSFPINASFGSNITYVPTYPKWVKLRAGNYSTFTITFVDQNLNPISIQDPNLLITLQIQQNVK